MLERYGAEPGKTSYANNCLVARRLAERGVRFIQLYHWGWDSHGTPTDEGLNVGLVNRCRETDQPTAALLADLKVARPAGRYAGGLGRRIRPHPDVGKSRRPGNGSSSAATIIPAAFTIWMAGGGIKHGISLRRDRRYGL